MNRQAWRAEKFERIVSSTVTNLPSPEASPPAFFFWVSSGLQATESRTIAYLSRRWHALMRQHMDRPLEEAKV